MENERLSGVDKLAWAGQKPSAGMPGLDRDPPNHQRASAFRPPSPQWSIATVKSLDISSHIPRIAAAMEAEDSPWVGTFDPCTSQQSQIRPNSIFEDVPSRSSSGANLNKAADTEELGKWPFFLQSTLLICLDP